MKRPPSQRPERQKHEGPENLVLSPLSLDFSDEALIDLMHQYRTVREQEATSSITVSHYWL